MINKQSKRRLQQHRALGFTLIEIMVVVAIIAILGATVVPKVINYPNDARVTRAKQDISNFGQALELYKLQNYSYPSTEQGLEALVEKPSGDPEPANWTDSYIQSLNKDPWNRPYLYLSPGENGDYDIISLGNDGAEGGERYDADLTNN